MEETKKCTKCNEVKPLTEFYWRKDTKKYRFECRTCHNIQQVTYYFTNHEEILKRRKQHRKDNPEKYLTESRKRWKEQKEQLLVWDKNWKNENPERRKEINNKANRKRRSTLVGRLNHTFSSYIQKAIKKNKNGNHWESIIDYTLQDLMLHLESKFQKDMSWNNYGKWHIDHIIPISWWEFNSYNDREFKQCWALCNLQPLWAFDNLSKKDKII